MTITAKLTPDTIRHINDAARAFRDADYALGKAIEGLPAPARVDLLIEQRRVKAILGAVFDTYLLPLTGRQAASGTASTGRIPGKTVMRVKSGRRVL